MSFIEQYNCKNLLIYKIRGSDKNNQVSGMTGTRGLDFGIEPHPSPPPLPAAAVGGESPLARRTFPRGGRAAGGGAAEDVANNGEFFSDSSAFFPNEIFGLANNHPIMNRDFIVWEI